MMEEEEGEEEERLARAGCLGNVSKNSSVQLAVLAVQHLLCGLRSLISNKNKMPNIWWGWM